MRRQAAAGGPARAARPARVSRWRQADATQLRVGSSGLLLPRGSPLEAPRPACNAPVLLGRGSNAEPARHALDRYWSAVSAAPPYYHGRDGLG